MNVLSGDAIKSSGSYNASPSGKGENDDVVIALPVFQLDDTYLTVDVSYDIVLTSSMTSAQASLLNGRTLKILASADVAGSNLSNVLALVKGSGGTATEYLNNTAIASGTFAQGNALALRFKYNTNGTYPPVANSATRNFAPALLATAATAGSLGGSGGGCALGTSALALAVLGLFIAKRRG
ncbi:MAG: hypothetical protein IJU31_01030 [Synergistaceae bacterium]|nr:hypothetical protein [Synergistaceae bacterium]